MEETATREGVESRLYLEGSLGQNIWNTPAASALVDNIYKYVGSRALAIFAGPHSVVTVESQIDAVQLAANVHVRSTVPNPKNAEDIFVDC